MPQPSPRKRRRLRAKAVGITNSTDAFNWLARTESSRINVVVEGDSWFAYPREWLFFGGNSNLVQSIFEPLAKRRVMNALCLASNGDTAKAMMSGKQQSKMRKLLRRYGKKIDLFLFSAGGNDVVGPDDLAPLLNQYQDGFDANQCINQLAFTKKLDDIEKHYKTLLKLRDSHAPNMKIICHTYDYLVPSDKGAEFLWGVEVSGPWILPSLQDKDIPEHLHTAIIEILLDTFRSRLLKLEKTIDNNFIVADTLGTLRPGHGSDWLNEIHPTTSGFNRLARVIYEKIHEQFPQLPKNL